MASANINVRTNGELKARAQAVLNGLGMDMSSAINLYLAQIVNKNGIPFELTLASPQKAKLGGWEGKIELSDDFNAPMEEFEEHM
jgi:DNA-damage-inducible protein J